MRVINWLKGKLPISRERYLESLEAINTILDGIMQSERHLEQIQMNLVKNLEMQSAEKRSKETTKNRERNNDVAFN